jgi:cell wall-associated NlpC family hydrolase
VRAKHGSFVYQTVSEPTNSKRDVVAPQENRPRRPAADSCLQTLLLMSRRMFVLATLMTLICQVSGTPYVSGGDSPTGTDCSGLASWVSNTASGRPAFGDRFDTRNEESALLARGFEDKTAPGALVIGWNGRHTRGDVAGWDSGIQW